MKVFHEGETRKIYEVVAEDFDGFIGTVLAVETNDRISNYDEVAPGLRVKSKGAIITLMNEGWASFIDFGASVGDTIVGPWAMKFADEVMHSPSSTELYVETASLKMGYIEESLREDPDAVECLMDKNNIQYQMLLFMIPIEYRVYGYLIGPLWKAYHEDGLRDFYGVKLPDGLLEADELPEPILVTSAKALAQEGVGDISPEGIIHILSGDDLFKRYVDSDEARYTAEQVADLTCKASIYYYKKAHDYAKSRGVIIADAKFEYGFAKDGCIYMGDDVLTPETSHFWLVSDYEPGHPQPSAVMKSAQTHIAMKKQAGLTNIAISADVVDEITKAYRNLCSILFPGAELPRR